MKTTIKNLKFNSIEDVVEFIDDHRLRANIISIKLITNFKEKYRIFLDGGAIIDESWIKDARSYIVGQYKFKIGKSETPEIYLTIK